MLTASVPDPAGYGRIVRDGAGRIEAIVEHKDATDEQRRIREINSGIYALELAPLFDALRGIGAANAQGEYYLPDLVAIYRAQGRTVETVHAEDPREILGVNSRKELADVTAILRTNRNETLMQDGVSIVDPASTFIGPDVTVGPDTTIHPGVYLEGRTRDRPRLHDPLRGPHRRCAASTTTSTINNFCVIVESHISRGAKVGPFAHIRPQSDVGEGAHVGNFVELKKTTLGAGSKANHLAYLGDATIGEKVNVGAGTITCNYDGVSKHADGHRGRRVHRQRLTADRAGHGRQGRVRRRRLDDHGRRARRCAGGSRAAGRQNIERMGRTQARRRRKG